MVIYYKHIFTRYLRWIVVHDSVKYDTMTVALLTKLENSTTRRRNGGWQGYIGGKYLWWGWQFRFTNSVSNVCNKIASKRSERSQKRENGNIQWSRVLLILSVLHCSRWSNKTSILMSKCSHYILVCVSNEKIILKDVIQICRTLPLKCPPPQKLCLWVHGSNIYTQYKQKFLNSK